MSNIFGIIISIILFAILCFVIFAPTKIDSSIINKIGSGIQAVWISLRNFVVGVIAFFRKK